MIFTLEKNAKYNTLILHYNALINIAHDKHNTYQTKIKEC